MNITITENNQGNGLLGDVVTQDETLKFGAGGTVAAKTILARDTSDSKLIPYVKGGSANGNGVPVAVLNESVTAAAAGDVPIRAIVEGTFETGRLVIAADGDSSNIDAPVKDLLRQYNLLAIDTAELNILDNDNT